MKRVIFLSTVLIIVVGLLASAQVIQMQVQVYPQQVLANAPFKVFVSAYSTSGEPISYITTTFNGTTFKATGSTAAFDFIAPSVIQSSQNFPLLVGVALQNGESFQKQATVTVSINANPVIQIGKVIPSMNSYIGNVKSVEVPVKVYGGLGLDKIEFMVDTQVASVINVSPSATVYLSKTFNVEISHLKNGWHIFSVKTINVAGEIFSAISGYIVNTTSPTLNFVNVKPYFSAKSRVPIVVTAFSTISGIANVTINGVKAIPLDNSTWNATILIPEETGLFSIVATATDGAGNQSSKAVEAFSDGMSPCLSITSNASMIMNGIIWGYSLPTFSITATTACVGVAPKLQVTLNNKKLPEESETIHGYQSKTVMATFSEIGKYNLKIVATDTINGLTTIESTILSVNYDIQPPQILNVDYHKYVGPNQILNISVTATDGNGIGIDKVLVDGKKALRINNDTWQATIQTSTPSTSGYGKFTVKAIDYLGKASTSSIRYFVDTKPPHVNIDISAPLLSNGVYWGTNDKPIKIEVSATTDSGISPQTEIIFNKAPIAYNNNWLMIITSSGTKQITVVSTNQVNGLSTVLTKTFNLAFDTAPKIEYATVPATLAPSTAYTVKVKVSDKQGPGIKSVMVNDSKAVNITGITWIATLTSLSPATSSYVPITITAYDDLNLSDSTTVSYFVDVNPPHLGIKPVYQWNKDDQYWNLKPPFSISISATTDSKVTPETTISIGETTFRMSGESTVVKISNAGLYELNLTSINPINNKKAEISKWFNVGFDVATPEIVNVTYPATIGANMPFKVLINTADGTGIGIAEVTLNGMKAVPTVSNSTWMATMVSANFKTSGEASFVIRATDKLGKKAEPMVKKYFVDTQPPTIEVYLGKREIENGSEFYSFEKATPTMIVKGKTSSMAKTLLQVTINGQKVEGQEFPIAGINDVKVVAINESNQKTSTFNAKIAIFVNSQASQQIDLSNAATITMKSDAIFKLNIEGKDFRYALLNAELEGNSIYFKVFSSTGSYSISLRKAFANIDGKYVKVELKAVDMAGNVSEKNSTVYVDTVGPKIKSVTLSEGTLTIYLDKDVEGTPVVSLENLNGKMSKFATATVKDNVIKVNIKGVQIPYGPYIVNVDGITDLIGNVLMNNGSIWEF